MTGLFRALAVRSAGGGGALLHPAFILSLVVLVVNDHWLKAHWPGVVSGKLSDFAGVLMLPLFVHGLAELACLAARRPFTRAANERVLLLCIAATAVVFALPEVWHPAEVAFCKTLSALRYPFRWCWALLHGFGAPTFTPVRATADLTDLLALPMLLLAWRVGRPVGSPASAQESAVSHSTW